MERTYTFVVLFFIGASSAYGVDSTTVRLYEAYISNSMVQWKEFLDMNEKKDRLTEQRWSQLLNYYYGYIAYCLGAIKDQGEATRYLERAEELLQYGEQRKYKQSTLYAYRSAFIGYRIALSPLKALTIGRDGRRYAEKAREADGSDPLAYIQLGNVFYFTPSLFGGSKEKALMFFREALHLFEVNGMTEYNWNYLNTLALVGKFAMELEQYELAYELLTKALRVEPRYRWVREELLPQCEQARKENK